ncbi:hypothetical protein AF78_03085 [Aliarcobacter butzleri L353]|uniref:hypothetical protein n=1 Tax=Aliarcobacter butzleri TaxID=28197 RepID=UPI0006589D56|nr:hypothetical protein [Aliarcobacter butzleri]KLE06522.1 hypothetical protein AF78_03085 [Aliarcobacter butzleri L353]
MKKIFISIFILASLNLFGANSDKSGSIIKQEFKKIGAISCADAMGKTVDFLLESREISYSTVWNTNEPNKNTINLSFRTKSVLNEFKFARYGSISYTPVDNECKGQYTYTEIVPGDCKVIFTSMKDRKNLVIDNDGNNNERYNFTIGNNTILNLITLKSNDNINCTIIKSEFISFPKMK